MTTTTHPAVTEYVGRIQAALADLPAAEVEEIVEDIGQHLSEVADELGEDVSVETLTERLGTPEQYASELRAAAGYPPASGPPRRRTGHLGPRLICWSLVLGVIVALVAGLAAGTREDTGALAGLLLLGLFLLLPVIFVFGGVPAPAISDLPEYQAFVDMGQRAVAVLPAKTAGYVRSLRPAWWLLRVVVLIIAILVAQRRSADGLFVLAPLVVLVALVWFGRRARSDQRWRWVVNPANAFAVGVGLVLLGSALASAGDRNPDVVYYPPSGLINEGSSVRNIYVFGPDGKPLPEVYLYDDNGQPITLSVHTCGTPPRPQDTNRVPQPRIEYDNHGVCRELLDVPFTVAIPQAHPTPTTGPTTTTSTAPNGPPATPPTTPPITTTSAGPSPSK